MIKLIVKGALAYSCIYYLKEEGVWKASTESLKASEKLNATLSPYVHEIKQQIPFEVPTALSAVGELDAKKCWNQGVLSTFQFLIELPDLVNTWTRQGIELVRNSDLTAQLVASTTDQPASQNVTGDNRK